MRTYIKIDGTESEILNLSYSMSREVGGNGQINSRFKRALVSITKDSAPMKGFMTTWMSDQDQEKEIEITMYSDDRQERPFKVIKIEHAKIFDYSESFDRDGNDRVTETFKISGEIVTIADAPFDFEWPEES